MMHPNSALRQSELSVVFMEIPDIDALSNSLIMIKNPRTITLMAGPIIGARCDVNSIFNQTGHLLTIATSLHPAGDQSATSGPAAKHAVNDLKGSGQRRNQPEDCTSRLVSRRAGPS